MTGFHAPKMPLWEGPHSVHWKGGRVKFRAGLDCVRKKKHQRPCRESNPDSLTSDNDQLDAQYFNYLLQSSTCIYFEQYLADPQEVKLY